MCSLKLDQNYKNLFASNLDLIPTMSGACRWCSHLPKVRFPLSSEFEPCEAAMHIVNPGTMDEFRCCLTSCSGRDHSTLGSAVHVILFYFVCAYVCSAYTRAIGRAFGMERRSMRTVAKFFWLLCRLHGYDWCDQTAYAIAHTENKILVCHNSGLVRNGWSQGCGSLPINMRVGLYRSLIIYFLVLSQRAWYVIGSSRENISRRGSPVILSDFSVNLNKPQYSAMVSISFWSRLTPSTTLFVKRDSFVQQRRWAMRKCINSDTNSSVCSSSMMNANSQRSSAYIFVDIFFCVSQNPVLLRYCLFLLRERAINLSWFTVWPTYLPARCAVIPMSKMKWTRIPRVVAEVATFLELRMQYNTIYH